MPSSRRASRAYTRGPHLYQRENGIWYAYLPEKPKGVSLGTRDNAEARRAFRDLVAGRADLGRPAEAPEEKLLKIAELWLAAPHGYTRRTLETYKERLVAIGKWLSSRGVVLASEITPKVLDDWVNARSEVVSRRTLNRDLRTLKVCLRWAAGRSLCRPNAPVEERKILREPKRERRRVVPDPLEMRAILAALRPGPRICLAVLYGTGVRIEELRRLAVGDLHDDTLHVRPEEGPAATAEPTKGYRERKIPLAPEAVTDVKTFLAWRADKRGRRAHKNQLSRALHAACLAAGVPKAGLHDLRRAFATECVRAGVPLVVVSSWLGHRLVATTERYVATYRSDETRRAPIPGGLRAAESVQKPGVVLRHPGSKTRPGRGSSEEE